MNSLVFCVFLIQVGLIYGQITYSVDSAYTQYCAPSVTIGTDVYGEIVTPGAVGSETNINNNALPWCSISPNTTYYQFWQYVDNMRTPVTPTCDAGSSLTPFSDGILTGYCQFCQAGGVNAYDISHIVSSCPVLPPTDVTQADCLPQYKAISPEHTACKNPLQNYDCTKGWQLTQDEKDQIVALHNIFRAQTDDAAALHMHMIYWDDTLEMLAAHHAKRCSFSHDSPTMRTIPGFSTPGQNIAKYTDCLPHTWNDAFGTMFTVERDHWTYGVGGDGSEVWHYTQLMQDDITRVGCAKTYCGFPHGYEQYFVCNYNTMQESGEDVIPYAVAADMAHSGAGCAPGTLVSGEKLINDWASKIPASVYGNYNGPVGNLCDSAGFECANGATMVVKNGVYACDCSTCTNGYWTGTTCQQEIEQTLHPVSNGECYFPFISPFNADSPIYWTCDCDDGPCFCPNQVDDKAFAAAESGDESWIVNCNGKEGPGAPVF